jgi:hypothetical protein
MSCMSIFSLTVSTSTEYARSTLRARVEIYEDVAAEEGLRLQLQSEDLKGEDGFLENVAQVLDVSKELHRLVQQTYKTVASRLPDTTKPKSTSRRSRSSNFQRSSNPSSNTVPYSPSTPPTSPLAGSSATGVPVTVPPHAEVMSQTLPVYYSEYPEREVQEFEHIRDRSELRTVIATEELRPRSVEGTIGLVIRANEQNEAQELYQRWRPDVEPLPDDEVASTSSDHEEQPISENTPYTVAEAPHNQNQVIAIRSDRNQSGVMDRDDNSTELKRAENIANDSLPTGLRQHTGPHRTNLNSGYVDIFNPQDVEHNSEKPGTTSEKRWKPMAPFDQSDGRRGRTPPEKDC